MKPQRLLSIPFPRAEPRFTIQRPGKPGAASMAAVPNTAQVALEAGNSPQMIFGHYQELVRAMDAEKWFGITPEAAEAAKNAQRDGAAGKIVALPKEAAA